MTDVLSIKSTLQLPEKAQLIREFRQLAAHDDALTRCMNATRNGVFAHPDGRSEELGRIVLLPSQVALITHLTVRAPKSLSIDIGFGMGTSATAIMAAKRTTGETAFEHIVFDPWGLDGGRGAVVEDYISKEFSSNYRRVRKLSQIGMACLYDERGPESAGLIFIDGGHTVENVMTDFHLSDLVCAVGGYIVFDDALFPAIETVISYLSQNRENYELSYLPQSNTAVLKKVSSRGPNWDAYNPFSVSNRINWAKRIVDEGPHESVYFEESIA